MSMDGVMLSAVKNDLENELIGARIDKIFQIDKKMLKLTMRQPGKNINLLISIDPRYPRIHLTEAKFNNPPTPPVFCMLLRKYLIRGIVTEVVQPKFERILQIKIENNQLNYYLIIELMGRYSNTIVIDEQGVILDAMVRINQEMSRERELYPGIKYKYPPAQDKLNPLEVGQEDFFAKIPAQFAKSSARAVMYNFRGIGPDLANEIIFQAGVDLDSSWADLNHQEKKDIWFSFANIFSQVRNNQFSPTIGLKRSGEIEYFAAFPLNHYSDVTETQGFSTTASLFDYYYYNYIKKRDFLQVYQRLANIIKTNLNKNRDKQALVKTRLIEGQNAEKFKKMGELITANLYQISKGTREIEVVDYYDPEQGLITITLDPKLSPSANAQKYFKKYSKAKKSVAHLKHELGKIRHEERYLEQVELSLEQADVREELLEIEEELKSEGYLEEKKSKTKRGRKENQKMPPHQFVSSQGFDILVGRNNHQNDQLTKKIANSFDIWLHAKDIPGSHVIIRNHAQQEIPAETIKEAAALAAYYSKGRMSANLPVDFTEVKNVNKPKGAKPGLVYYDHYQTVFVNPDSQLLKKLKK